jgi:hypothetical protein
MTRHTKTAARWAVLLLPALLGGCTALGPAAQALLLIVH